MSTTMTQPGIAELLEQDGARPRGRRFDCPKCGGLRTIAHTDETFFCHKCQWKGNAITLAKELGTYRPIPAAEYRELRYRKRRAHEAARRLYAAAHKRQLELQEEIRSLGLMEILAHEDGPTDEAWEVLAEVYGDRPRIETELDALESDDATVVYSALTRGELRGI